MSVVDRRSGVGWEVTFVFVTRLRYGQGRGLRSCRWSYGQSAMTIRPFTSADYYQRYRWQARLHFVGISLNT
jgi:hypothetical protein